MYEVEKLPAVIDIGFVGEKNFRPVEIDMSAWMEKLPNGVPSIVHIRPGESKDDAYIASTTFEDNILTWIITDGDLGTIEGTGVMQVWLEESANNTVNKRGKSAFCGTRVHDSISSARSDPPEAQQAWIDQMTALKDATVAAAQLMSITAQAADVGKHIKVKSVSDGKVSEYELGTEIDDTAGEGVKDRTWSADKIIEEIGSLGGDIPEAVSEWLDAHPEATTTVEDGSITKAKLNTSLAGELDGKAAAIITQTAPKSSFTASELAAYDDFQMICDASDHSYIYKLLGEDIYPDADSASSTYYTKAKGRTVEWNGTLDAQKMFLAYVGGAYDYAPKKEISNGDTVNLFVCVEGTNTGSGLTKSGSVQFMFLRADGTSIGSKWVDIPLSTGYASATYSPSADVGKVRVYIYMDSGCVFDHFKVSYGGSLGAAYTAVEGGSELEYSKSEVGNNGFSTLPVPSSVQYVADTKTYIDNNIPEDVVTEAKLVYLSPEMYGAAGDAVSDDTAAVQACITAAIAAGKPVRGYGAYKTTSTITIDGSYVDVYLKYIDYRGSSYAVQIAGKNNKIRIDDIFAQSDGASGILITAPTSTDATEKLLLSGACIFSHTHAIVVSSPDVWLTYIAIQYKLLYTATKRVDNAPAYGDYGRDAIYISGKVTEVAIYDATFACQNGWCVEGNAPKLFNCTMEHNVWGGVYCNGATIQNCRARELMDCLMPSNTYHNASSGILYKHKDGWTTPVIVIAIDDCIYYDSIDLSDAEVKSTGDGLASLQNAYYGIVRCPVCIGDLNYKYGEYWLGKDMILHGKDKICTPLFKGIIPVVHANCDLRDPGENTLSGTRYPYPYKFVISVADCVIHLAPSYCAEGYDEFIVDMTDYMATVIDRRGNTIFDPTNQTAGVYKFTALVDDSIDDVYQTDHSLNEVYPINSGYCDVWTVEKLS